MEVSEPKVDWRTLSQDERKITKIAPTRLSVEPASEWYCPVFIRRVGIIFCGIVQSKVIEYDSEEGWVRRHVNPSNKVGVSRNGKVVAFKSKGVVQVVLKPWDPSYDAQLAQG